MLSIIPTAFGGFGTRRRGFGMLLVVVVKNFEMIDAVVCPTGVAGRLAYVIVGPAYGYSSRQGTAVEKQDRYQRKRASRYQ